MGKVNVVGVGAEASVSCWQEESGELWAVLGEVFGWLGGGELAAAAAACRAWRRAAADGRLWRRLLLRAGVHRDTLRALNDHHSSVSWRQEYVNVCAEWELVGRVPQESVVEVHDEEARRGGGAPLTHAALHASGTRLALAADDATFSIWEQIGETWREEWSTDLKSRAWSHAVRSEWALAASGVEEETGDVRLLVTGALALADRWELLVLRRDKCGAYLSTALAGCSAGAGGCWAGAGDVFLSLELSRLAPRLALTVVWLNAATQETQSEYAGVTSPLLRVFNEDSAHLTHVLVAAVPLDALATDDSVSIDDVHRDQSCSPGPSYYQATDTISQRVVEETVQVVVTASHGPGGALRAWAMRARRPPPLRAADCGSLAVRARRRRESAAAPPHDPDEPDEDTVRAMCDPPDAECYLHAAVLGLVLHPSKRCVWASTADGRAWCVSLPALRRLCALAGAADVCGDLHYVQPAVTARYVAVPTASRRGGVRVWSASSGALCPCPPRPVHSAAPALVCMLPPQEDELLVLAGHAVYVWRSRATPQPD